MAGYSFRNGQASAIGKVAIQLAAGYGQVAIPLAIRRATAIFEQRRDAQSADWYLVIVALRDLESMGRAIEGEGGAATGQLYS